MSWSTDSQWLGYTVVSDLEAPGLSPRWLFDTAGETQERSVPPSPAGGAPARFFVYRIWATAPSEGSSVLLEESRSPLTAPSWSPRGKSIAFGRFVPRSGDPQQPLQRGRLDVVVQSGLDVRNIVWSSPELELDQEARALIPHLSCSWSADQAYLAIPLPTPQPAVVLVHIGTKKSVHIINNAILPVWAPDGARCAYIRREGGSPGVESIERRGPGFGVPRPLMTSGVPLAAHLLEPGRPVDHPGCGKARDAVPGYRDGAVSLDNHEPTRLLGLVPEVKRRSGKLHGVTIDFSREPERCYYAVDLEGHDFDLVSCTPQDREIQQRFHPLDVSQRIGALAVSPDSKWVAVRFGSLDHLSPPAVVDTESERTFLFDPGRAIPQGMAG